MRLLVALALILATCVPALAQQCFIETRMTADPQVLCPSGDRTSTLTIELIEGTLPWSVVLSDGQVQSGGLGPGPGTCHPSGVSGTPAS